MKRFTYFLGFVFLSITFKTNTLQAMISETIIQTSISTINAIHPNADTALISRGVKQVADLWNENDGTELDFQTFVSNLYVGTPEERQMLYDRLVHIIEQCNQSTDNLNNLLQAPTTLVGNGEPTSVDWIISGYNPMAHFKEDMFANKIAHICILNFPYYSLEEKNNLGKRWNRQEWAYARLGDIFHSRVPGNIAAAYSQTLSKAENYIASYNIMMHCIRNERGEQLWKEPMALLSHWNLRDELKSNYANNSNAHEKQEMIYQVMLRIIRQEIPECIINNDQLLWCPTNNSVSCHPDSNIQLEVDISREPDTRYQQIINIFHALQAVDVHRTDAPSHVLRTFNED